MLLHTRRWILLDHVPLLFLQHDQTWQPNCAAERILQEIDIAFQMEGRPVNLDLLAQRPPDMFESVSMGGQKAYRWRKVPCEQHRAAYYAEDISAEFHWKKRAAEIRLFHPLTHLPNFAYTLKKLETWHPHQPLCGVRIGLLNLAVLNELYGEEGGNEAIKAIARHLQRLTQQETLFLSQLSGNHFFIAGHLKQPEEFVNQLHQALSAPITLPNGQLFHPRIAIGWCRELDITNPAKALEHLHLAQKHASHHQRPAELQAAWVAEHERKITLEIALRHALTHHEFELFFQPKFDARQQRVDSCEALIRWHHPKQGLISPLDFIPLAEKSGLIVPLGEWVLDSALSIFKQWLKAHPHLSHISVNVSPVQLLDPGFAETIMQLLDKHQLPPHHLELELTESGFLQNHEEIIAPIMTLGQMEVRWAIDDFGTGYSSLARLKELPFSRLKIDRAFIRHIDQDQEDRHLTQAIVQMAEALGLNVVAEGVEDEAQKAILTQQGCMEHQGYFYGKPMPAQAFETLLDHSAA